ncbi:MAG: class I SAM-dependent methyltransferase [Candidatus Cloacimonetes bacterium]|nr:class I SAM-dependent methyltransferase [Candidatus Cloacimonadota bacterium]
MTTNWDNFVEIYDWEFDLLNESQKRDVAMWESLCREYGPKVLEIGAGTGRISLQLAKSGITLTAIDNAPSFISKLKQRNIYPNLSVLVDDMLTLKSTQKFDFCFLSYSTFQYLLTREEQVKCLTSISKILVRNGRVGFDLDPHICDLPELNHKVLLYKEYNTEKKCFVSMFTKHKVDKVNGITSWNDEYFFHNSKNDVCTHNLSLKEISLGDMKSLFSETGFCMEAVYGGFEFEPYNDESERMIIIAKKNKGSEEL